LDFAQDNYSISGERYSTLANAGVTFSRGTNATLIDSTGLLTYAPSNQFTNSENFSVTTSWPRTGLSATTPVVSNTIAAPNGTITADKIAEDGAASAHYLGQTFSSIASVSYTTSIYAKAAERQYVQIVMVGAVASPLIAGFNLSGSGTTVTSAGSTSLITSVGDGWYRCSITATATVSTTGASVQFRIATSLSTTPANYPGTDGSGLYIWGAQTEAVTYETAPRAYNSTTPKNLFGFTEEFNNAAWTKTNSTVTANAIADPNGYLNADKLLETAITATHYVQQVLNFVIGTVYTFSFYAKAAERSNVVAFLGVGAFSSVPQIMFNLTGSGSVTVTNGSPTGTITALANGWYRCSMKDTCTTSGAAPARIMIDSGADYLGVVASGIYVWGAQLSDSASLDPYVYNPAAALTSTAYYGPRFEYDPLTLNPLGLLIEEARTNLLLQSEQLDNAAWAKSNGTISANIIVSPDGTTNADAFIETTTPTSFHYVQQTFTKAASNIQYTATVYAKAKGRQMPISFNSSGSGVAGRVDLDTGTVVAALGTFGTGWTAGSLTITPAGNGWYRVVVVATSDILTTVTLQYSLHNGTTNVYTGDGVSGVYLWGAQLEAGGFATSYIPTVAASATRSADVATMVGNNFTNWYNQTTGTFAVTFDASANANAEYLEVCDTSNASNSFYFDNAGGTMRNVVFSGGSSVAIMSVGAIGTIGVTNKLAGSYALNDFAVSRNGGTVVTDTVGAVPVGVLQMNIGRSVNAVASTYIDGHIKSISYYNTRLRNDQLQVLTA
jgi:hypothetical protein